MCMTLTTSEPGEQSVPCQRYNNNYCKYKDSKKYSGSASAGESSLNYYSGDSPHLHYRCFFCHLCIFFPVYLLVALVISYTFHIIIIIIIIVVVVVKDRDLEIEKGQVGLP